MNEEPIRPQQLSLVSSGEGTAVRMWILFGTGLMCNSILRGIRAPGRYVYTELLQNYSFGFCKRGLLGTVIAEMNVPFLYHYSFCVLFCFTIFFINIVLLADTMRRLCAANGMAPRLATLVFASSLSIVVLSHTIGYGDHVGLLVTLIAWRTRSFYARSLLVAALFSIVILIHETNFVLFFPVIIFRFALDLPINSQKFAALTVAVLCVLATVIAVSQAHLPMPMAKALYQSLQPMSDFPLRQDEASVLSSTFYENERMVLKFWNLSTLRDYLWNSWIVALPTTLFLMRHTYSAFSDNRFRRLMRAGALFAILAPLSLHFVAFDIERWTTLTTVNAFIVFASVTLQRPEAMRQPDHTPLSGVAVPLSLIALNLSSTIPLFDGYIVQNFPYVEHVNDVVKIIRGDLPFPPPPALCEESGCLTVVETISPPQSGVSKRELRLKLQQDLDVQQQ